MTVELGVVAAHAAGFAGTVVMSLLMNGAKAAGMTNMPPVPLVAGSMMSGDRKKAAATGAMVHFVVMGPVVFGLAYAALFTAFDTDAWWAGLAIGAVHGPSSASWPCR